MKLPQVSQAMVCETKWMGYLLKAAHPDNLRHGARSSSSMDGCSHTAKRRW